MTHITLFQTAYTHTAFSALCPSGEKSLGPIHLGERGELWSCRSHRR